MSDDFEWDSLSEPKEMSEEEVKKKIESLATDIYTTVEVWHKRFSSLSSDREKFKWLRKILINHEAFNQLRTILYLEILRNTLEREKIDHINERLDSVTRDLLKDSLKISQIHISDLALLDILTEHLEKWEVKEKEITELEKLL